MSREITEQQYKRINSYVRQKGVRYYDLQFEVVDHFVEAVTSRMNGDQSASFEAALNGVYRSFDDPGFRKLIRSKKWSLHRHWCNQLLTELKSSFSYPKILLTIGLFSVIYSLFYFYSDTIVIIGPFLPIIIISYALRITRLDEVSGQLDLFKHHFLILKTWSFVIGIAILLPNILSSLICYHLVGHMGSEVEIGHYWITGYALCQTLAYVTAYWGLVSIPAALEKEVDVYFPLQLD